MLRKANQVGVSAAALGFTILELLVALSISGLLIFLIGSLFGSISDAVSLGINQGEIAARSNTISQQLQFDFEDMVGPGPSVLAPDGGILIIINHQIGNVPLKSELLADGQVVRPVRSDQVLFVRRAGNQAKRTIQPLVGLGADTYESPQLLQADHARIWYGHGRRVLSDGSDTLDLATTAAPSSQSQSDSELNLLGSEFILCRQALFLKYDPAPGYTHADRATVLAQVFGGFIAAPPFNNTSPLLYRGLADVANVNLSGAGTPALVGPGQHLDGTYFNYLGYKQSAYQLTYSAHRLRVNPNMPDGLASRFDTWRVAQMHPILTQNVSDFIIEFAADIDSSPGMDRIGGEIKWYSHFVNHSGAPGYNPSKPRVYPPPNNYAPYDTKPRSTGSQQDPYAEAAFVWRHDSDTHVASTASWAWPHLIRIRYRLHDDRGVVGEAPDDPGRWFEQIVDVKRD